MSKKSIAILFGGKSVEHQISINSAKNIFSFIDRTLFDPIAIGISPKGDWFLKTTIDNEFENQPKLSLSLSTAERGFVREDTGEHINVDIVFPVLHGTDGEDGSIQGLLQAFEYPFVGTGVLGSAIAMSKLYTKRLLQEAGIPTSKFLSFTYEERESINYQDIEAQLGLPFMAKAANLGSSVGVVKVKDETGFEKAIEEVFTFDNIILFEQYVEGRELECSIMGNQPPISSLPAEIVISDAYEFYTYEAKYLDETAVKLQIPAALSQELSDKIREYSIRAYQAINCQDFARVDLFLKDDGEILLNEINTIPGFTNSSMFPMMWKERGISFTDLITKLIHMAFERYDAGLRITNEYKP